MTNKATGMIIKYNRMKQHISQAELSKDICVPSYLSKIENGEIIAHSDIYKQLLNKLNVSYAATQSDSNDYEKIHEVMDLMMNLKRKEAKAKYTDLDSSYENSPYVFEYLAMKYYYSKENLSDIKSILLESVLQMDDKTAFFVLVLLYLKDKKSSELLDRALKIYPCGYGHFIKGLSLYKENSFSEAYKHFAASEQEYLKVGSLNGIINAKRHQGIIMSAEADKKKGLEIFISVKKLLEDTKSEDYSVMLTTCEYNINFLKHELGEKNDLENVCKDLAKSNLFKSCIPFHVLQHMYMEDDPKKAEKYVLDGLKIFTDQNSSNHLLLDLDLYKLHTPDYIKTAAYYSKLQTLRKSLINKENFIIKHKIENEMIDYLKANRKYKEALALTEAFKNPNF